MSALSLTSPVHEIRGVGEKRAQALRRAGIETVEDLIQCFPRTYRSGRVYPIDDERIGLYSGFYLKCDSSPGFFTLAGRRRALRFSASDEDGRRVNVIYVNQPYLKNQIFQGDLSYYFGVLQKKGNSYFLFSPERKKDAPDPERLYPVYPAIKGFSSGQMEKIISQVLVPLLPQIRETLPENVIGENDLLSRARAVFTLHVPESEKALARAKERFAFEELFHFSVQATLFSRQMQKETVPGYAVSDLSPFFASLPFSLTDAQMRVIGEIQADICADHPVFPMNRLLQGDVGSGKTVVAAAGAYLAAQNNKSTLVMAPTEILAQQHYHSFQKFFYPFQIPVLLLTGSTTKKEREEIWRITTTDTPYILVGTHALTEEGARCRNVGLAIADEQHRFGVRRRTLLSEKGGPCHSLVMSATPIPRSLAMFLYAKGKISVIDQLPPGRQVIDTLYVGEDKLPRIYAFLDKEVQKGQQAYIVCPLIEDEEEKSPLQSAKEEFLEISKALPNVPCALLHGKMKNDEKNQVMADFKAGKIKILVSTTVIEVGVDVPRATVMVIRSAERFGLSQLHQLRGRVGRGENKSYCILVSSHSGKSARERLKKLCTCHDGFELAKFDLKTRGPGEFFGTRQSGFMGVDIRDDISMTLIQKATDAAEVFLSTASPQEIIPYEKATRLN